MGKVLSEYPIYLEPKNAERKNELIVIHDCTEDGYGVYIDFPYDATATDTIVFGEGQLAAELSKAFFTATCLYFERIGRKANSLNELHVLNNEWSEELFLLTDKNRLDVEGLYNTLDFIKNHQDRYLNPKNQWFQTDDLQWVIVRGVTEFEVIEITRYPDEAGYSISHHHVDLKAYSDNELLKYITLFGYQSIEDVVNIYGGEYSANQIIAECIAEMETVFHNGYPVNSVAEMMAYLKDTFGIEMNDFLWEAV